MSIKPADPSVRIFRSPASYYQGPRALDELPRIIARLGSHPLLVVDAAVLEIVRTRLGGLFAAMPHSIVPFRGEVTLAAMEDLAVRARSSDAGIVVGMGGGKALDAAKGCAVRTGLPYIAVPTVASNDSPTATALAVYDDEHRMVALESLGRNPDAVVVDTQLIAGAPAQFFRAGIGDALAKKFEGESSQAHGGLNAHFSYALRSAGFIADGCYRTIRECAVDAIAAAGTGKPNAALEAIVEANILMAGLAFENMGLGLAHGLTRGLVRVPVVNRALHGFHVAYGLLVQLETEGRSPAFMDDIMAFYGQIGLPRSLIELGLSEVDAATIDLIASSTAVAPEGAYLVVAVDAPALVQAMMAVEARFRKLNGAASHG